MSNVGLAAADGLSKVSSFSTVALKFSFVKGFIPMIESARDPNLVSRSSTERQCCYPQGPHSQQPSTTEREPLNWLDRACGALLDLGICFVSRSSVVPLNPSRNLGKRVPLPHQREGPHAIRWYLLPQHLPLSSLLLSYIFHGQSMVTRIFSLIY